MFVQAGGPGRGAQGGAAELIGSAGLDESPGPRAEDLARLHLRHAGQSFAVADLSGGNPQQPGQLDELLDTALPGEALDHGLHLFDVFHPSPTVEVAGVFGDVLAPEHRAEIRPLLAGDHAIAHVAVLGGFDGRDLDAPGKRAVEPLAAEIVVDGHADQHALEDGEVHVVASSGFARRDRRTDGRGRGEASRGPLADAAPRGNGFAPGQAPVVDGARGGLKGELRGGAMGAGALESPGREGNHRERRMTALEFLHRESLGIESARAEAFDENVRLGNQGEKGCSVLGHGGIQGDAPLGRIQELEENAVLSFTRVCARSRPTAQGVAAVRALHLDHVGARVGEHLGAVRTRDCRRKVDHPPARQRPGAGLFRFHAVPFTHGPRWGGALVFFYLPVF